MQYSKLELHIIQVERLIANSRKKFSNKKKEHIYQNMLLLFSKIKESNYSDFNSNALAMTKGILDIIFYSIEFLDYKTESEIPKRLIFCLNKLLNDWIKDGTNEYFIVISYNNTPGQFFIRAAEQEQVTLINLQTTLLFGINYSQSLILISKPKFLANDYLNSIPLYHELGHFVEKNYQIVTVLAKEQDFKLLNIPESHFKEFFADLFAAQYIGISAVALLDESKTNSTKSHPSNAFRVEVLNAFMTGTGSSTCMMIIKELNRVTQIRTGKILEIRYENLEESENPFISLKPEIINNDKKIHNLFNEGWRHWLNTDSAVRKKYPKFSDCAMTINNLIRNSIRLTMQQDEKSKLKKLGNCLKNHAINWGCMAD